jgi:HD-GYP domain-containing protein (c-di-GMP phosphodiesterase class II)
MTSAEYQEALKNAAKSMVRVKNPRRLLRMMTRFIDREVGLTHTSILVLETSKNRYIFVDSKGNQKFPVQLIRLDNNNPIVEWFLTNRKKTNIPKDYVTRDLLDRLLESRESFEIDAKTEKRIEQVREAMKMLRAAVCFPGYYKGELLGILILGDKKSGEPFTEKELNFFETLTFDAAMAIKNAEYQKTLLQQNEELAARLEEIKGLREKEKRNYYQVILSLATEVDEKDHYTFGHAEEVVKWGVLLAEELKMFMDEKIKNDLVAALKLHDIGKIGIPDCILKKPGRLTDEEFEVMKEHSRKGARILEPLADFREVAKAVLYHHENIDGTGYPDGLKGDGIPYLARIVSIADAFHAMISDRPYKKRISHEEALHEITLYSGKKYDPVMVDAFSRVVKRELAQAPSPEPSPSAA